MKQIEFDIRIKSKHISWREYALTLAVLSVFTIFQPFIFGMYQGNPLPLTYIVTTIIYWAAASLLFCFITNRQLFRAYDRPVRRMSHAAKQVAEGDFSVYLEPLHTADKYDYMDIMFADFNKMVETLGGIETLKNDFVSNVSHELKTPIAVIQSYVQLTKKKSICEQERVEYCDSIIEATQRLTDIITNILRLNKLENQEINAPAERYDLCGQLCDCVLPYDEQIEKKGIELIADLEEQVFIHSDRSMLEIMWNNLLSNALKFTEPGGRITLRQRSAHDHVIVEVSDTGCGMSEETIPHIFDKFYQGDTSHGTQGNGLGLALVSRVVKRCGGTIAVSSILGEGSTFTVMLPKDTFAI